MLVKNFPLYNFAYSAFSGSQIDKTIVKYDEWKILVKVNFQVGVKCVKYGLYYMAKDVPKSNLIKNRKMVLILLKKLTNVVKKFWSV